MSESHRGDTGDESVDIGHRERDLVSGQYDVLVRLVSLELDGQQAQRADRSLEWDDDIATEDLGVLSSSSVYCRVDPSPGCKEEGEALRESLMSL